jgi:hypothetical protein
MFGGRPARRALLLFWITTALNRGTQGLLNVFLLQQR